jgi:hypothetical protein
VLRLRKRSNETAISANVLELLDISLAFPELKISSIGFHIYMWQAFAGIRHF